MGMKFLIVAANLPGLRGGGLEWYRNKVTNKPSDRGQAEPMIEIVSTDRLYKSLAQAAKHAEEVAGAVQIS